MKILNVDRKYDNVTGKKTYECFLTLEDGTEKIDVFPDYPPGCSVIYINNRYYLEDIDRTCYETNELAMDTISILKENADFFYKIKDTIAYERYEKAVKEIRNIAKLFKENPYILCEKEDENGESYAPFHILDKNTNINSFKTRLKELRMMALYILDRNEKEGHTWMTYEDFSSKFEFLLEINGHPLITGDASAVLNYFKDFYVDLPLTPMSRVAKRVTKNLEFYIEKCVRSFFSADSLYRKYRPPMTLDGLTNEQLDAIRGAILSRGRFSILTGGPGTGKTTVISQIVEGMQIAYPNVSVRLLAPTGKAAKRIEEQMNGMEVEVSTIHKFLGYGKTFVTKEDIDEMKKSGLVIIDESSMIDVSIFCQLLTQLDMTKTKIILVGDENQLPSIGAGNVLHDLIAMGVPTFRLTINHRNSGLIDTNAKKIINGEIDLKQDEHFVIDERSPRMSWAFAGVDMDNDAIIVPYHSEKKVGSVPVINKISQERHRLTSRPNSQYNIGDVVICLKNNYRNGYLNGDVGFYRGKSDDCHEVLIGNKTVNVLDQDLELGYAITIHKSQGSEYPTMSICIPEYSAFITRKMLYTAITRAKSKVILYTKWKDINRIILNNKDDQRRTFLGTLLG